MELEQFEQKLAQMHQGLNAVSSWHRNAYLQAGVELPFHPDDTWINVSIYADIDGKYQVDAAKTKAYLGKIARFAAKQKGIKVEKRYDTSDFSLDIELPEKDKYGGNVKIRYVSSREAICEKRVVGTTFVPEKIIPAREEEIVEWDCTDTSLLSA